MPVFSKIKRMKGTSKDPYRIIPIPPKSVVRFNPTRPKNEWRKKVGELFRVGYYGRRDGLDCIWLVDDSGEYVETIDHLFLFKHFDIIVVSDENDLYGKNRPSLPAIRWAGVKPNVSSPKRTRSKTGGTP